MSYKLMLLNAFLAFALQVQGTDNSFMNHETDAGKSTKSYTPTESFEYCMTSVPAVCSIQPQQGFVYDDTSNSFCAQSRRCTCTMTHENNLKCDNYKTDGLEQEPTKYSSDAAVTLLPTRSRERQVSQTKDTKQNVSKIKESLQPNSKTNQLPDRMDDMKIQTDNAKTKDCENQSVSNHKTQTEIPLRSKNYARSISKNATIPEVPIKDKDEDDDNDKERNNNNNDDNDNNNYENFEQNSNPSHEAIPPQSTTDSNDEGKSMEKSAGATVREQASQPTLKADHPLEDQDRLNDFVQTPSSQSSHSVHSQTSIEADDSKPTNIDTLEENISTIKAYAHPKKAVDDIDTPVFMKHDEMASKYTEEKMQIHHQTDVKLEPKPKADVKMVANSDTDDVLPDVATVEDLNFIGPNHQGGAVVLDPDTNHDSNEFSNGSPDSFKNVTMGVCLMILLFLGTVYIHVTLSPRPRLHNGQYKPFTDKKSRQEEVLNAVGFQQDECEAAAKLGALRPQDNLKQNSLTNVPGTSPDEDKPVSDVVEHNNIPRTTIDTAQSAQSDSSTSDSSTSSNPKRASPKRSETECDKSTKEIEG